MALSVASFNIGGDGTRDGKKVNINKFMDANRPSLLLIQENLWRKDNIKDNIKVIGQEYESVSCDHQEAAVLYRKDVLQEDTTVSIINEFEKAFNDTEVEHLDFKTFKDRASFAKLTEKATKKHFIAVSWHGEHSGIRDTCKKDKVKDLVSVIKEVFSNTNWPVILGGDFNIALDKVEDVIKQAGFEVYNYDLENRDTCIDFFIVTPDHVELSVVKALGEYMEYMDVNVFDHDPVQAWWIFQQEANNDDNRPEENVELGKLLDRLSIK